MHLRCVLGPLTPHSMKGCTMLKPVYPARFTDCLGKCGAQVAYKTNKRVYCETCRLETIRRNSRETMTKVRRAQGIAPVNVPAPCSACGTTYIRIRAHSHRCPTCQAADLAQRARDAAAAKRATEEGQAYHRRWANGRRAVDPSWSVNAHMTTLMHRALGKGKAGRSWRTFVDYSLEELMAHLERQFLPGMTWDNRGEWHIDHIVPRSSFQYEGPEDPAFRAAWSLPNLRPIWALDNQRKNARRTHLI